MDNWPPGHKHRMRVSFQCHDNFRLTDQPWNNWPNGHCCMDTGQVWSIDGSSATIEIANGSRGGVLVFQTLGRISTNTNAPYGNVTRKEEIGEVDWLISLINGELISVFKIERYKQNCSSHQKIIKQKKIILITNSHSLTPRNETNWRKIMFELTHSRKNIFTKRIIFERESRLWNKCKG